MCGFQNLSRQHNHKNEFKLVQLGLQMTWPACFVFLPVKIIVERHDVKNVRKNKTRTAHKSSFYYKFFICKINLGQGRILSQGRILGQGQILGKGRISGQGQILRQGQIFGSRSNSGSSRILGQKSNFGSRSRSLSRSMCVWLHLAKPDGQCLSVRLHLAKPDVSVDSADGASSGLIR